MCQTAIQGTIVAMIAFRDTDAGTQQAPTASHRELQGKRHGVPVLDNPSFNWDAENRHVKLKSFEMEVTNILETKVYELSV